MNDMDDRLRRSGTAWRERERFEPFPMPVLEATAPRRRWGVVAAVAIVTLGVLVAVGLGSGFDMRGGTGPGAEGGDEWGPLTVVPDQGGGMDALATGRLTIGDTCVTLQMNGGGESTLVWEQHRTSWDADTRTITYDGIQLRDGDEVSLGGGEGQRIEGDARGCPASRWWVSSATLGEPRPPEPDEPDWGPLALYDDNGPAGNGAVTQGTLLVTDTCVTLRRADGTEMTLYWPESRSTWAAPPENAVVIDGDVLFGDAPIAVRGGEAEGSALVTRPADVSCPTDAWLVTGATMVEVLPSIAESTDRPATTDMGGLPYVASHDADNLYLSIADDGCGRIPTAMRVLEGGVVEVTLSYETYLPPHDDRACRQPRIEKTFTVPLPPGVDADEPIEVEVVGDGRDTPRRLTAEPTG